MDSKKSSLLRSLIVFVLAMSAVFQTGLLWLDENSGHNFFYYLFNSSLSTNDSSLPREAIRPENITVGTGDDVFNVVYNIDTLINAGTPFIVSAVDSSEPQFQEDFYWENCLREKCAIYEFATEIPFREYFAGIGAGTRNIPNFMESFNFIAILPLENGGNGPAVYFINTNDSSLGKAAVYTSQASSDMSNTIDSFLSSRNIQFISTNQSGFNIFSNNMFVPQLPRDFKYTKISKTPSIDQERMSLMDNQYFESVTEQYFDRYSSKTISSEPSGICTISDTSTVVKYYPYGVIEYFNYSAQDMADEVQSLSSAYYVCMEFLEKDTAITTPYYLSGTRVTGDGFVFDFDYYVNNTPVFISGGLIDTAGVEHAIEVVVDSGGVKKYKKYAFNFSLNNSSSGNISVDFLEAINSAMAVKGAGEYKIDDIKLGYYVSGSDSECGLSWFVDIEQSRTVINAETGDMMIR